jgi:hypothetical protein
VHYVRDRRHPVAKSSSEIVEKVLSDPLDHSFGQTRGIELKNPMDRPISSVTMHRWSNASWRRAPQGAHLKSQEGLNTIEGVVGLKSLALQERSGD